VVPAERRELHAPPFHLALRLVSSPFVRSFVLTSKHEACFSEFCEPLKHMQITNPVAKTTAKPLVLPWHPKGAVLGTEPLPVV
jgi:hypothetical protein